MPMTPMPALTFRHSTPHSSQNCGVRMASFTCTCADGDHRRFVCFGLAHPAGRQPGGGMR